MNCDLVIDSWELGCCGPVLTAGTLLHLTLTALRWPVLAQLLDWPGVPSDDAVVWRERPTDRADSRHFLVYGSLHGPDEGPRVPLVVEEVREIRGALEPDPGQGAGAVRLKAASLRIRRLERLPARLGAGETDSRDPSGLETVSVALRVRTP